MKLRFLILLGLFLYMLLLFYVERHFTDNHEYECVAEGGVWDESTKECQYEKK